jgi:hypothetical protein
MQSGSSSQQLIFTQSPKTTFFLLIILRIVFAPVLASPTREAKLWEPVTWTFRNPSCTGNPFDLVVKATFTHALSGQKIQTEFFYDDGDTWKLRFTGTHVGLWSFITESADPELNGLKGKLEVEPNPGVPGFIPVSATKRSRLTV